MVNLNYKKRILIIMQILMFNSCTLFTDSIKIEVPKDYIGWCYVIPVSSSNKNASPIINGKYQIDSNGIVLIPSTKFDIRKDNALKIYEGDQEISKDIRYAGTVHKSYSINNKKYDFIHFYLPSKKERAIPDATQYWRDKMYEYRTQENKIFDSLLKEGKIIFFNLNFQMVP